MTGRNERAILKIFEKEPDLEISVTELVEKFTGKIVFNTSSSPKRPTSISLRISSVISPSVIKN